MTVIDRFKAEYGAKQAYDTESKFFDQEHLKGKAWIARNDVVMLVHKSVGEVGVMDLHDCETPVDNYQEAVVPDDVNTMVDSGETLYELSGGGRTHVIAERYCKQVADLFDWTVSDVLANAYLDASKANFPVRIDGNGDYDAVISPYLGDTE